mmetsp:Transcript_34610/g.66126  ORF Transcript_34610/g.66126 Transcript_34610/m.66126 type:complete len:309 (-) Transcript_34610:142-1068(-)
MRNDETRLQSFFLFLLLGLALRDAVFSRPDEEHRVLGLLFDHGELFQLLIKSSLFCFPPRAKLSFESSFLLFCGFLVLLQSHLVILLRHDGHGCGLFDLLDTVLLFHDNLTIDLIVWLGLTARGFVVAAPVALACTTALHIANTTTGARATIEVTTSRTGVFTIASVPTTTSPASVATTSTASTTTSAPERSRVLHLFTSVFAGGSIIPTTTAVIPSTTTAVPTTTRLIATTTTAGDFTRLVSLSLSRFLFKCSGSCHLLLRGRRSTCRSYFGGLILITQQVERVVRGNSVPHIGPVFRSAATVRTRL